MSDIEQTKQGNLSVNKEHVPNTTTTTTTTLFAPWIKLNLQYKE